MKALAVHYRRRSNKARILTGAHGPVHGQHRDDGDEKTLPEGEEEGHRRVLDVFGLRWPR